MYSSNTKSNQQIGQDLNKVSPPIKITFIQVATNKIMNLFHPMTTIQYI